MAGRKDKPYLPHGVLNHATGQVTLNSSTATLVVPAREGRSRALLRNLSASITVYIGDSSVTSSTGWPLLSAAGGGESFAAFDESAIYAIAASGAPVVTYWEEYE